MTYEFSCDWFTARVESWKPHIEHLKDKPFNYLEVGSYEGRSILYIHDNYATHPDCNVVSIDPFPDYHDLSSALIQQAERRFKSNTKDKNILHFKCDLMEYFRVYFRPNYYYDLIYVDGSHLSFDCYTDAQLAWRLLKEGGVMVLDDYELNNYKLPYENCATGIDYFLKSIEGKYKLLFKNWQVGIIKL